MQLWTINQRNTITLKKSENKHVLTILDHKKRKAGIDFAIFGFSNAGVLISVEVYYFDKKLKKKSFDLATNAAEVNFVLLGGGRRVQVHGQKDNWMFIDKEDHCIQLVWTGASEYAIRIPILL